MDEFHARGLWWREDTSGWVTPTQSEFVVEEFETSVTKETTTQLAQEIEDIVRSLRRAIDDDDVIEEILRDPSRVLREADSVERSDPEPLTQQVLIEPLFAALNYPTFLARRPLRSARPTGRLCGLSEGVRRHRLESAVDRSGANQQPR